MNLRFVGDSAVLIELRDSVAAQQLRRVMLAEHIAGVRELVPGYDTLLVEFDPLVLDADKMVSRLPKLMERPPRASQGREHQIEVHYDGADLEEVAHLTGLETIEVIRRHGAPCYSVAFLGFAPGFPYLVGLDRALRVTRLKSPRTRVPAGSVAIAGEFTGIYPQATPGGWRVLGHTDAILFDAARAEPALLLPGDKVRFRSLP